MAESGGGTVFPVVFFDGEREINIGNVRIHPSLDYKTFQSVLSQKIGVSPNQISIYLVDRNKPKLSPEVRWKIPITGKVNFSAISREKDCFFLVVLKRSRRDRRRKSKENGVEFDEYLSEEKLSSPQLRAPSPSPEKLLLLRRNNTQIQDYVSPYHNQIVSEELMNYNNRMRNLQAERENYMMMNLNSFQRIEDSYAVSMTNNRVPCEDCVKAKEETAPFHICVHDRVVRGWFRSTAGPIARPSKASR